MSRIRIYVPKVLVMFQLFFFSFRHLVACPEETKEGYKVLLYRLTDFDPSHVDFLQGMKAFFAFNDVRLSEDGVTPGYVVVFDMQGITLSHLGIVTLSGIRKFMHYIQVSAAPRRANAPRATADMSPTAGFNLNASTNY